AQIPQRGSKYQPTCFSLTHLSSHNLVKMKHLDRCEFLFGQHESAQGDELRLLSKQRLLALWNMLISITTIPRTSTSDRYGSTSTYQEVILIMSTAPITCYFNYNGRRCPNDT
ncbi:unnamed protein product, partial [Nesidiocoris tenuis]